MPRCYRRRISPSGWQMFQTADRLTQPVLDPSGAHRCRPFVIQCRSKRDFARGEYQESEEAHSHQCQRCRAQQGHQERIAHACEECSEDCWRRRQRRVTASRREAPRHGRRQGCHSPKSGCSPQEPLDEAHQRRRLTQPFRLRAGRRFSADGSAAASARRAGAGASARTQSTEPGNEYLHDEVLSKFTPSA